MSLLTENMSSCRHHTAAGRQAGVQMLPAPPPLFPNPTSHQPLVFISLRLHKDRGKSRYSHRHDIQARLDGKVSLTAQQLLVLQITV